MAFPSISVGKGDLSVALGGWSRNEFNSYLKAPNALWLYLFRMFIWEDGSLEILNVTRTDEGKYTCFAHNDRGKANSTGSLTVTGT